MTDDTVRTTPEDEGRLVAAEYVLGVLSAEERRAVVNRVAHEPEFAREVAYWEERLGGMASFVAPITAPTRAWLRVEAAVSAPPYGAAQPSSLWESLAFWRGVGLASAAIAGACLAALVYVGMFMPAGPAAQRTPLLATLTSIKTKQPNFVAALSADGSLTIVPAALLTTDKRSMELWLIPQGGKPHSLGLIAAGQPVRINVPPDLLPHAGKSATLAVSLEPPGGSPTGQPTGEVIAHGDLTRL
jgi:anti-sigma-K factor RskA